MLEGYHNVLQKCELFHGIPLNDILHVLDEISFRICSYDNKERVFQCSQEAEYLAIILENYVTGQKISLSGNAVNIGRHYEGELVAHTAVFAADQEFYPVDYCACMGCTVMMFHKEQMLQLLKLDQRMMNNFLKCLSRDIIMFDYKVELLCLTSTIERVAFYLLSEYEKKKSAHISLEFSKKMWAEFLNVPRTSLARELRKLQEKQWITMDRNQFELVDIEALRNILNEGGIAEESCCHCACDNEPTQQKMHGS